MEGNLEGLCTSILEVRVSPENHMNLQEVELPEELERMEVWEEQAWSSVVQPEGLV